MTDVMAFFLMMFGYPVTDIPPANDQTVQPMGGGIPVRPPSSEPGI